MISKEALENLKRSFLHQYIVIYLCGVKVTMPSQDGESVEISAAFEGFTVNIDEAGYYLGNEETGDITKFLPHGSVGVIELMSETASNFEHLLDMVDEGDVH